MSLRNRVAIAGGAVVLCALVLASLIIYRVMGTRLGDQRDAALVAAASRSPDLVKALKTGTIATGRDEAPQTPVTLGSTVLQVVPPPVAEGPISGFTPLRKRDVAVADGRAPAYFAYADHEGRRYRVYTSAFPDLGEGTLVRAAEPVSVDAATLRRLGALLIGLTLGGALLAAATARLAAGRVLRPVRRLTDTVEHVAATQDLTAEITTHGRDEIARLAASFATMMAALDESVQAQRRLVADASHELRTPLTSLTTNLELLHEGQPRDGPAHHGGGRADPQASGLVGDARDQVYALTVLVNDLIDLARYGRAETHTEDVRLDLLAERVVAQAAARAPGTEFRTELSACLVHADPDAVERAIGNLVANAVKWSPAGGRILVRVDGSGGVSVSDEGPGIPAADLPYVFDRFYRSPAARSQPGSGLGLAIVRQIAQTHGGAVAAEPLERGVRLRMSLPAVE